MTASPVAALASLVLPLLAAVVVVHRLTAWTTVAVAVLVGTVAYTGMLVVPIQLAGTLKILGLTDGLVLLGPAIAGILVLLVALRVGVGGPAMRSPSRVAWLASPHGKLSTSVRVATFLVVALYLFFTFERLSGFPSSWDAVAYHLPVSARWLQEGGLGIPAFHSWQYAVTGNGDILGLLALATGWVALGEVWNVTAVIALVAATVQLSRHLGVDREGRVVTGLLAAAIPVVLFQTFSAYVDLFAAAWIFAFLTLLVVLVLGEYRAGERLTLVAAAGCACGLAVGTKATMWPASLLLFGAAVAWLLRSDQTSGERARLLTVLTLAVAAPSFFWFLRNFVATGNPVYPFHLEIFGHTLATGYDTAQMTVPAYDGAAVVRVVRDWLLVPWTELTGRGYPFSPNGGLGPLFAALVIPGVLYALVGLAVCAVRGGPWDRPVRVRAVLVVALLVFWLLWWFAVSPVLRFGLPVLLLMCVLAGPFADVFRRSFPRLFGTLLVSGATVLVATASLPKLQNLTHRIRHGEWSWEAYYHVPPAFLRLPEGSTVVNIDGSTEGWNNFVLLGPDFRYRVIPYRSGREFLENGGAQVPFFVVDRAPYQLDPAAPLFQAFDPKLVTEATVNHGDETWRIWRLEPLPKEKARPHSDEADGEVSRAGTERDW